MKRLLGISLLFAACCACAQVEIRVSVKRILGANGSQPGAGGYPTSPQDIRKDIEDSNRALIKTGRAFHFRLTEVTDLTDVTDWFDAALNTKAALEVAARSEPNRFAWRDDAINVYVNNVEGGGICSFPAAENIILYGRDGGALIFAHEIGHYFNLRHTHEGASCCNRGTDPGCAHSFGDDGLADTLPDADCASRDEIAFNAFGLPVSGLNEAQRNLLDNTLFNVMSYHQPFANNTNLTAMQMDVWTDAANGPRRNATTGKTVWVDRNNSCPSPNDLAEPFRTLANALPGIPDGERLCRTYILTPGAPFTPLTLSLGGPYKTFTAGVSASGSGDVVLVRGGQYNEPQTINKRVTLAATRGTVVIGAQ